MIRMDFLACELEILYILYGLICGVGPVVLVLALELQCEFHSATRGSRIRGAMVTHLTPDQKVACGIHVEFTGVKNSFTPKATMWFVRLCLRQANKQDHKHEH